jgi:hypothetical protein
MKHEEPEQGHVTHSAHHTPHRVTRYSPGHVHEDRENHPEGGGVLGDLSKREGMPDGPVPSHEMPNMHATSHAAEVSGAMAEHGNDFKDSGVMKR